jgi:hypothetical protein
MNLGKLPPQLEGFIDQFKALGFSTRTQMITEAIEAFRLQIETELRLQKKEQWLAEYASENSE